MVYPHSRLVHTDWQGKIYKVRKRRQNIDMMECHPASLSLRHRIGAPGSEEFGL